MTAATTTPLDRLARGVPAHVAAFLTDDESLIARLVEMGFDEGVPVVLTDAALGRDPLAVRIGATKVALRRRLAAAIAVTPAIPTHPATPAG